MVLFPEIKKFLHQITGRQEARPLATVIEDLLVEIPNRPTTAQVRLPDVDLRNYFVALLTMDGGLSASRFELTEEQVVHAKGLDDPAGFLASTVTQLSAKERKAIKKWLHGRTSSIDLNLSLIEKKRTNGEVVGQKVQLEQEEKETRRIRLFGSDNEQLEQEREKLMEKLNKGLKKDRHRVERAVRAISRLDEVPPLDFFQNLTGFGVKRLTTTVCGARYELKVGKKDRVYFNIESDGRVDVTSAGLRGNQRSDGGKKSGEY